MRGRRVAYYLLLLLVLLASVFAEGIADRMQLAGGEGALKAGALLVYAVVSWCFQLAPVSVVGLSILILAPVCGLMSFPQAVEASFGDSTFAFFLGVLLLGAAFKKTYLGQRLALAIFRIFGSRPRQILFGLMLAGTILAMWVTEVAAAAIIYPLALSITSNLKDREDSKSLSRTLMIGVAWGPAFGGVATPIATGANLVAVNYLESYSGITVSFGHWMLVGVPIAFSLLVVGWFFLSREIDNSKPLEVEGSLPPFTRNEAILLVVFISAILLWTTGSITGLSSHLVALGCAVVLFLPGLEVMQWKDTVRDISWDSIILICSGILLGDILIDTGVASTLANLLFMPSLLRTNIFFSSLYIVLMVSILKIMFSSNTVAGVLLVPIMISLSATLSLDAWHLVAPCIFSSALAFIVVTSSPVNVIPFASGAFTPGDLAKRGIAMTLASALVIAIWLSIFSIFGL